MPHWERLINHENDFIVWFNYVAQQYENGNWENPSENNYANIYTNDDNDIEEIVPIDKTLSSDKDGLIVVNFKKFKKTELYFAGLYVVTERKNRSVYLKRISYTFNTDNVFEIDPTDEFYKLKKDSKNYLFDEQINKLFTRQENEEKTTGEKEEKLANNTNSIEEQVDNKLNIDINYEFDDDEYKFVEPKIELDLSNHVSYKRNRQVALNAIFKNGKQCEIDNNHKLFFKEDNSKYIEVHHIIPMSALA